MESYRQLLARIGCSGAPRFDDGAGCSGSGPTVPDRYFRDEGNRTEDGDADCYTRRIIPTPRKKMRVNTRTRTSFRRQQRGSLPHTTVRSIRLASSTLLPHTKWLKNVELPEGRTPTGIGAVEIALRASAGKKKPQIFLPAKGMVFDSVEEAHEFYNLYSWEVGFGIRHGRCNRNPGNEYRTMQQLECAKAGKDNRCKFRSQRSLCRASCKLLRTDDHGWYVSQLIVEHNHPLSTCCGEKKTVEFSQDN